MLVYGVGLSLIFYMVFQNHGLGKLAVSTPLYLLEGLFRELVDTYKFRMKNDITISFVLILTLILMNSCSNRQIVTLTDIQAGGAESEIKKMSSDIENIGTLIISGSINKADLDFINKLEKLSVIDLMNAKISDIQTLKKYTFNSTISSIILPHGIDSIGELSFFNFPRLKSVKMPNSIIYIGRASFSASEELHDISLSSSLKEIGENAFDGCKKLRSIELPESLEIIDSCAFLSCEQLEFIKIPVNVSYIGRLSFAGCENLKNVIIEGNPSIDYLCFYDAGIKNIHFKSEIPPIVLNCDSPNALFGKNFDRINIFVPKGSLHRYKNAPIWEKFWKNMTEE